MKFGGLRHPQPNLQALAAVVAENENVWTPFLASRHFGSNLLDAHSQKAIGVLVRRSGTDGLVALRLVPRQGWGGRGSIGYVPWFALYTRRLTAIIGVTLCHTRHRNIHRWSME